MKERKSGKFEFSFSLAVSLALVLHVLAGLLLKYNIVVATPITSMVQRPPVSMRFVEVPPNAPIVKETPRTNNISDANRIASPGAGKRAAGGNTAKPAKSIQPSSVTPSVEPPSREMNQEAVEASPSQATDEGVQVAQNPENLMTSLKNLDKYIGDGGSGGEGGGSGAGEGKPGSGAGVLFDTKGHDLGPWGNQVVAIVRSNWLIPVAAELGLKGVVGISFEVSRQGQIGNLTIVSESGVPSFDQAALNALKSSNPLPPLPTYYPEPVLKAVFRFYYNTPVPPQ